MFFLVTACASGTLDERHRDAGDAPNGREPDRVVDIGLEDVAAVPDAEVEVGRPDAADATPDVVDGVEDVAADDVDEEPDTAPTYGDYPWEAFATSVPEVADAIEASRDAMVAYCLCCGDGGPTCPEDALDGPLPGNSCTVPKLEALGDSAIDFLACAEAAYNNLDNAMAGCAVSCEQAQQNFSDIDMAHCTSIDGAPAVLQAMASCAAEP